MFTKRQQQVLKAILSYAASNVDDINDAFASFSEDDPDNEDGKIEVNGEKLDSISDEEIEKLRNLLQG